MAPSRREQAKQYTEVRNKIYEDHCTQSLQRSIENLGDTLSSASRSAVVRVTAACASDPYGDGDQSPVPGPHLRGNRAVQAADPLRSAWSTGLDVHKAVFDDEDAQFHLMCFMGDIDGVNQAIIVARQQVASGNPHALHHLLERRVSLLRLTPLHYCCHGSRTLDSDDGETGQRLFYDVAKSLLDAGARPDSRDLCGYTPLSTVSGFSANEVSLKLVPLLHNYGADPNIRTRFGESIIIASIMTNNPDAFRALLLIGGDVMLGDNDGLTPRDMAAHSPAMMRVMTEAQREIMLSKMRCEACGKSGADKFCSACRKAYYCSKKCQSKAWKEGHKQKCGKDESPSNYLDIVVRTMTSRDPFPGIHLPIVQFTNNITGATSRKRMKPKEFDVAFVVKVSRPIMGEHGEGCVKINIKNSDFLLVKNEGEGLDAHGRLKELVRTRGIDAGKVYLSAKWLKRPAGSSSDGSSSNVLRLDLSKPLPPPKPLW